MQRIVTVGFLVLIALAQLMSPASASPDTFVNGSVTSTPVVAVRTVPDAYQRLILVEDRPINLTELETTLPTLLAALGVSVSDDKVTLPTIAARNEYALSLQYLSDKLKAWSAQHLDNAALTERIEIWQRHRWHANGTNPYDGWRTARAEIERLDAAASTTTPPPELPQSSSASTSMAPLWLAAFLIGAFALLCWRPSPVAT